MNNRLEIEHTNHTNHKARENLRRRNKLSDQEIQVVRFMFLVAALGILFSILLPFLL